MNNPTLIRATLETDRGQVRPHNEDFVTVYEPTNSADETRHGRLYIVADGVGGADAGEVASQYASEQMLVRYLASEETDWGERLVQAMQDANTDLRQYVAESGEGKRMATTMVTTIIHDNIATIANVGDSRGYYLHQGQIEQITKDQSLVAKLLEEGAITEAEAAIHPHRNVILYSIGSERTPKIDRFEQTLEPGDRILLCSDGLTRHVTDSEIREIVNRFELEEAAKHLIELANLRGGQDNISAALIGYGEKADQPPAPLPTKVVAQPASKTAKRSNVNRAFLLPFTVALSAIETALIFLVWHLLRV